MRRTLDLCVVTGLVSTLTLSTPSLAEEAIDLDAVETPKASATSTTLMVPAFTGARSKTIHTRLVKALQKSGFHLVPESAAGGTKLGNDPANYIFVARSNGVQAFVGGKIKLTANRWILTLEVRSGANGTVAGTETITSGWLPGLLKAIDKEAKPKVDGLLATAGAASSDVGATKVELVPPDEGSETETRANADPSLAVTKESTAESGPPANQVPTPLMLSAGGGLILRNLSYTDAYLDTLRQELYPHGIALLGMNVSAMWYPGAHFTDGVLANIGLNAHFIRSFGGTTNVGADKVPTQVGAPPSYPTVFQELDLGLRGRIPMDSWEIGLNLGWGKQRLGLEGDNQVVRLPYSDRDEEYPGVIPDIDVEYYRFGADVGFELFDWSWVIGAGFRTPFFASKPGQIAHERWFPKVIGTTATANMGVNIPLYKGLGLAVNADFRQTGLDMNTTPNAIVSVNDDPNQNLLKNSVAGGATDRHILVSAALTLSFGSASTGGADKPTNNDDSANEEPEDSEAEDSETDTSANEAEEDVETTASASAGAKDTSDPSFFGQGAAGAKAKPAPKAGAQKDTSNPDFFK